MNGTPTILTYTGQLFSPAPLNPAQKFNLKDIARSLSMTVRYRGHVEKFYSVAEHSVHVASMCQTIGKSTQDALAGLMHDAVEAYICDMPPPYKDLFPQLQEMENEITKQLAHQFGFPFPLPECVHAADKAILHYERRDILPEHVFKHTPRVVGDQEEPRIQGLMPADAEKLFLDKFDQIWRMI